MKIAYFVNEYPKVSHSFIRREILAVERQGMAVQRIALRGWCGPLPDPADQRERERTQYVLRDGVWPLLIAVLRTLPCAPLRLLRALRLAVRMARDSDRPLPYHLIYLAEACRMLPWFARFGASHVHAHFGTNSAEVVMLARILGGPPYSFTVHGPDEFLRPLGLEDKIHYSSFVATISNFSRSQLYMRCSHADWSKIKVVRCGLDKDFYDIDPVQVPDTKQLVCVGRLCEAKGQLLLIEAASRLAAEGTRCEIILAGDGPMRADLQSLIDRYQLGDRIHITGWISGSEVRRHILASRALVLPSFAEGLPVVLMEAMALRRPVLTTYIAGIPELVRDGENGWLFSAGSASEIVKAIKECLSTSAAALRSMGEASYQRVLQRHSIDTEARVLAELFRRSE